MRPRSILVAAGLAVAGVGGFAGPAGAQASTTPGIAGGASLAGHVVELPQGGTLGPTQHVFARNDGARPIEVEFLADAPGGITVRPARERVVVGAGALEQIAFSIDVDPGVARGDHEVRVGLARADVSASRGQVGLVPAFSSRFVVRVVGAAAMVEVTAHDVNLDRPAAGVFTLTRVSDQRVEMARNEGTGLEWRVAPGEYEARFQLGKRTLASTRLTVGPEQTERVQLEVETLSFGPVSLQRGERDGVLQTVELYAVLDNGYGELPDAETTLVVERDGTPVDAIGIQRYDALPTGAQSVRVRYLPDGGWTDGRYRFVLQLVAGDVAVRAADQPELVVEVAPATPAAARAGGAGGPVSEGGVAVGAIVVAVVGALLAGWLLGRRRRGGSRPPGAGPADRVGPPGGAPSPQVEFVPADGSREVTHR